jgi:hypothetical protein
MCFLSVRDFVAKIHRKNEFWGWNVDIVSLFAHFFLIFICLQLFGCKKIFKNSFL